jgi:DNA-directed RNA polymerase specialized sigma24 family protein
MDLETIRRMVQKGLSESERKLHELRHEDGLSLDEIAMVTGRPKSSVKVVLSTARKKMMERMKKINIHG